MKKIYLILMCFSALQASAQWSSLGVVGGNTIRAVRFLNADTGFVADFSGGISKTIDGGTTWTHPSSGTTAQLRGIEFLDDATGYICGGGVLLKTTDGGDTWSMLTSPSLLTMRAIDFVDANNGCIAGSAGTVFHTTDGGASWTTITLSQTGSDVIQLQMANANTGYLACANASFLSGYIYKTTDGGASWNQIYSDAAHGFLGLAVIDSDNVIAGGYLGSVIQSTDGGSTWTTGILASGGGVRAGFAVSSQTIYLVDDFGYVSKTDDGGATWDTTLLSGSGGLFAVHFPTASVGYTGDLNFAVWKYDCPIPATPDLSSDPLTICSGDTLIFIISEIEDATGYKWILPEGAVIIDGDGTTTVTVVFGTTSGDISVFATGACTDGEAASESITVHITPDVPTITFDLGVLTSSASSGNQWYYNGNVISGATDPTYTPTQNGTYSVIVTSVEGCSSQSEPFEVVGVGIGNLNSKVPLTILPNPMNQLAQINIGASDASHLIISDVQGKLILDIPITSSQLILNRGDLSEGMYQVQLLNNKNELISRMKLVVQ